MEINTMKKIIVLSCAIFLLLSCKKNQIDGDATVEGIVKHHSKIIPYASIFIKYNAIDLPSTDTLAYDAKVRADKDGYYTFNAYKGKYFVYAFGYDYAIPAPFHVVGGQGVKLRSKEKVTLNLFVTEGD